MSYVIDDLARALAGRMPRRKNQRTRCQSLGLPDMRECPIQSGGHNIGMMGPGRKLRIQSRCTCGGALSR